MPIYHEHKCIFTHIPKCAGCSIHKILCECLETPYEKAYSDHLKLTMTNETENYFKFTFVRNPWDRFLSTYFYFRAQGRGGRGDAKMGKVVNRYKSFKDFALNFNNIPSNKWVFPHFNEQLNWISKNHDFVGRFETLQEDFKTICDRTGIPRHQLPHENKSNHKHYTESYDEETKQIIAEKYAKDIEYFGYKFE